MTLNDVLADALEGIERHQGDNPDAKLDALRRHIAVFLADQEAAPPSEPTYAKKRVVRHPVGQLKGG